MAAGRLQRLRVEPLGVDLLAAIGKLDLEDLLLVPAKPRLEEGSAPVVIGAHKELSVVGVAGGCGEPG